MGRDYSYRIRDCRYALGACVCGITARTLFFRLLLIVLIAAIAISFRRISAPAARLLAPYLVWCCFAAMLNAQIWLLNGFPM
ncbi:MAG: TspO/MBR family protein [Methanoregula sp.]